MIGSTRKMWSRALLGQPAIDTCSAARSNNAQLQELTRAQRRLSEQLKANRSALQELMAESPVRQIIHKVIAILVKQLSALGKKAD